MRDLTDKVALVTGAAGGIGRALALRLAEKGARLALVDVDAERVAQTALEAEALGAEATAVCCDLADPLDIESLAEEALDRWAGVDLLVNNAGVTYHGATHTMPMEEWERLLAINLHAPIQLTGRLLPAMLARPEAHVLNVASVLGLSGMPRVNAYCTTKFAMVGYSESLRAEYGRQGLGVTCLCPGFVSTGLFGAARPEHEGSEPKAPPEWFCISPERVAKRAVRAVERDEQRVVIDPMGRPIHGVKRGMPGVVDWLLTLGRGKRVARKRAELEGLHPDRDRALRLKLGLSGKAPVQEEAPPLRRAA